MLDKNISPKYYNGIYYTMSLPSRVFPQFNVFKSVEKSLTNIRNRSQLLQFKMYDKNNITREFNQRLLMKKIIFDKKISA